MRVTGGLVYDEYLGFVNRDVCTGEEYFTETSADDVEIGAAGCYVIPGLVDVHIHGCMGHDLCDATPEAISAILAYEASRGITAVCPTTMTVSEEKLLRVAGAVGEFLASGKDTAGNLSHFIGINMEGPFISPEKKGAQELSDIRDPDEHLARRLMELCGGKIAIIDIAPEMHGAMEFIEHMAPQTVISIAHTDCDYDTALKAMKLGAHHVTHLYNAMRPYLHRAPGVIGAATDDPECMVELICDGVHHHATVDRNTFRLFGSDRIVLISDSMRATGLGDGTYELGGHDVTVRGHRAVLADGTIAASVTDLYDCMVTCIRDTGIRPEDAVKCATINPARSVGADDMIGSIETGKYADFLLIDRDTLELKEVYLRGSRVR